MSHPFDPHAMPLTGHNLIEASAGTGKTFNLAALYLRLIVEQAVPVREILVVTFTKAAAKELRERIQQRLVDAAERAQQPEPAQATDAEQRFVDELVANATESGDKLAHRLVDAANRMDEATITTIHGFAQRAAADNAFDSALPFDRGEQVADAPIVAEVVADYWRAHAFGDNTTPGWTEWWPNPKALADALKPLRSRPEAHLSGPDTDAIDSLAAETRKLWTKDGQAFLEELRACWDDNLLKKGGLRNSINALDGIDAACDVLAERLADNNTIPALPAWVRNLTDASAEFYNKKAPLERGQALFERPLVQKLVELQPLAELIALRQARDWVDATVAKRKRQRRQFSFDDMIAALHEAVTDPQQGDTLAASLHTTWPWALVDEFQDTDPRQYAILRRIYDRRDHGALMLIGDPKQSIYSFRGGDVHTYLEAARHTQGQQYTLDKNFRTIQPLLDGIEALFATPNDNPFLAQAIDFPHVTTGRDDERSLCLNGEPTAALTLWHLSLDATNKPQAEAACRNACVEKIRSLLDPATKATRYKHDPKTRQTDDKPLASSDIAVLVNDNKQAAAIQRALARTGIAAVCVHQASVFDSDEANDLLHLLKAAAEPADERLIRGALPGALTGYRLGDLLGLDDETYTTQSWLGPFQTLHQRWQDKGVLAALQPLIQDAAPRLLGYDDGERRLSNYLQLAELLAQAENDTFGIAGLLHWLRCAIRDADTGDADDAAQLRLESDAELVRIATIHKAKGLEFPVVFIPFAPWIGAKGHPDKPPFHCHDDRNQAVIDMIGDSKHRDASVREARAEGLRLLYVALTRAELACYLPWGVANGVQNSALASLLHRDDGIEPEHWGSTRSHKPLDTDIVKQRLQALDEQTSDTFAVTHLPEPAHGNARLTTGALPAGEARAAPTRNWRPWGMHSFTRLVHAAASGLAESGASDEDMLGVTEPDSSPAELPDLPAGPAFGTAVHTLLEQADPTAWPLSDTTTPAQSDAVAAMLRRHGIAVDAAETNNTTTIEATAALIQTTLHTPLPEIGPLAATPPQQKLVEMGFMLRMGDTTLARFLESLNNAGYAIGLSHQASNTLRGMMNGFIDLIVEAGGRYFIIDYKTNWLGDHGHDYHQPSLQAAIQAHHYDLQYVLYSLALHRYLRQRLPEYDPARHLGGIQYLFLRGMSPDAGERGIYRDQPDPVLITELDRLLDALP